MVDTLVHCMYARLIVKLVNLSVVLIDQVYEKFTVELEDLTVYKQEKGLKQVPTRVLNSKHDLIAVCYAY